MKTLMSLLTLCHILTLTENNAKQRTKNDEKSALNSRFWVVFHAKYSRNKKCENFARISFLRNFAPFSLFFALFIFAKKCKISRKILQSTDKIFAFFRETFRSLQTIGRPQSKTDKIWKLWNYIDALWPVKKPIPGPFLYQ